MDYRDLVFLSVADNLSLSKAADELFISQPAVTRHIKELEGRLGISLFDRKGSKIFLTDAGRLVYSELVDIREQYRKLEYEIGRLKGQYVGKLQIGASSTIMQYVLPGVLAAFNVQYPDVELFVLNGNSSQMEQNLQNGDIDIALVENESSSSGLRYIEFMSDEIVPVTSIKSVYAKKRRLTIEDLFSIPIIVRERGSGTLEVIRKSLERNGFDFDMLNVFIHLGSTEAIKNYLNDFQGLALISEKAVQKSYQAQNLVQLSLSGISFTRSFRICLRQGQEDYSTGLFIKFLNEYKF
jgi:DNA-binding transcriptional LysR family regulator